MFREAYSALFLYPQGSSITRIILLDLDSLFTFIRVTSGFRAIQDGFGDR